MDALDCYEAIIESDKKEILRRSSYGQNGIVDI